MCVCVRALRERAEPEVPAALLVCSQCHLQLLCRPLAAQRTQASIGIAMIVLVVLVVVVVVCPLVHLFNLSLCNFYAY